MELLEMMIISEMQKHTVWDEHRINTEKDHTTQKRQLQTVQIKGIEEKKVSDTDKQSNVHELESQKKDKEAL